jgi:hypothetical protein
LKKSRQAMQLKLFVDRRQALPRSLETGKTTLIIILHSIFVFHDPVTKSVAFSMNACKSNRRLLTGKRWCFQNFIQQHF